MAILEILSPFISAGIGLIGAAAQRKHERLMAEIANTKMQSEFEHEFKLTELNMQARREEIEQEIALDEVRGANEAFVASYSAEQSLSRIKWGQSKLGDIANFARSITRPLITYTMVVTTILRASAYTSSVEKASNGGADTARLVYEQMSSNPFDMALINMTALVVSWWFGSRGSRTAYKDKHYSRSQ